MNHGEARIIERTDFRYDVSHTSIKNPLPAGKREQVRGKSVTNANPFVFINKKVLYKKTGQRIA